MIFPPSVAPDSLLLNSPFAIPDSVRITYGTVREDTIDSWGIVRLPNGDFPVLRERQKESITTKIEILYASLFGWLDVTTVVLSGLTQPFYSERFYFNYWHATTQEPIAVVETDTRYAVRGIQYKAIAQRVDVPNVIDFSDKLTVFPNPTMAHLSVNFDKINTPINSILIMNYSGRLILNKLINTEKSLELAVDNWQNGAYLICLLDKEGRIIGKQRFVKN